MTERVPHAFTVAADRSVLWCPLGRNHDRTERMMPADFVSHAARTQALIDAPQGTVIESMPWGGDRNTLPDGRPGSYLSFGEYITSTLTRAWGRYTNGYFRHVWRIVDAGLGYGLYLGCVRTELDESVGAYVMSQLPESVRFYFDAGSLEGPDSRGFRFAERHGGPSRFGIEATPRIEAEHWKGYPLIMYARDRRRAEESPGVYAPDEWFPEITVVATGHTYGDKPRSIEQDARDLKRWSRQDRMRVGWMTHEAAALGVEVVR